MRQPKPKLGCRTQTLTSVCHHFLVQNVYIYIWTVLGISPVWKSTKTSQNPLVHCRQENCSFQGGTTLHNSRRAEYVDRKGAGLVNLEGIRNKNTCKSRIFEFLMKINEISNPPMPR